MKTSKIREMRALPMIILLGLSFVWVSLSLQGQDKTRTEPVVIYKDYISQKKSLPKPQKISGIASEIVEHYVSINPLEKLTYEVYLDKFVVWTKDTAAVLKLIGNKNFIKNIINDEDMWAIFVNTGDTQTGKSLRERLRNKSAVTYLENYVYSKGDFECIPTRLINVCLNISSDYNQLKQIADSLNLILEPYEGKIDVGCRFDLKLTEKTELTRSEIVYLLIKRIRLKSCEYTWVGNQAHVYFTFDPFINLQWGLYNRDNLTIPNKKLFTDLDVSRAWNYATGRNIKICVIDTGFDLSNEDLEGNCLMSYDAYTKKNTITFKGAHGTACAGVACAIRNNNFGVAGVAPDASLMAVRVWHRSLSSQNNFATQFANAIDWAIDNGADIISCSLGFEDNSIIRSSINKALTNGRNGKGCVFVAASGNDAEGKNEIKMPGNVTGVMCIGSVNSLTNVSKFSNYGKNLFAVAPGENIVLLDLDDFVRTSGTSYACPAVAGVAALVLQAFPSATVEQIRSIIAQSASIPTSVTDTLTKEYGTWNQKYGYGLVNAYEAVKLAVKSANSQKRLLELPYPDISSVK